MALHDQTEHDKWFDNAGGIAYRIRDTWSQSNGRRLILDSKQHTDANNHNTFKEELIISHDEAAMLAFSEAHERYNWLTIDKVRRVFSSDQPELSISMDTINGVRQELGIDTVLELEYTGVGSRDDALAALGAFASSIQLGSHALFEKSLTVEAMQVLAKFR